MSNTKLQVARELIEEKRYAEARALLKTMPKDPTALKWLAKLEQVSPPKRSYVVPILGTIVGILIVAAIAIFAASMISAQERQTALVALQATEASNRLDAQVRAATEASNSTITAIAQFNASIETQSRLTQTEAANAFNATLTALVPTATDTTTFTPIPTLTDTPTFTLTPSVTNTPRPTLTITPTWTRGPSNTPAPTITMRPTDPPPLGTRNNPVANSYGYRFGGLGALFSTSQWSPGQTGLAIVSLRFECERPADQVCDTGNFMLDVVGSSGNVYERVFERGVPEPSFGSFMSPEVYGGGTSTGYAGFLITNSESNLSLRVRLFLQNGEVFFDM